MFYRGQCHKLTGTFLCPWLNYDIRNVIKSELLLHSHYMYCQNFSETKETLISLLIFLKTHLSNCWKDPGIARGVLLMILKLLLQFLGGFVAGGSLTITLR